MISFEEKDYLTREEFFMHEQEEFQINPLDINLAKAQHDLLQLLRSDLASGKTNVETSFGFHSPMMSLSKIAFKCHLVSGSTEVYDLVMRVEDDMVEKFAYAWLIMGTIRDIENKLDSNVFVPLCKRWIKWFDYAQKNYPMKGGMQYNWTEWQPIESEKHWYKGDPDLYGICSDHAYELMLHLSRINDLCKSGVALFNKDTVMNCRYPGAPEEKRSFHQWP